MELIYGVGTDTITMAYEGLSFKIEDGLYDISADALTVLVNGKETERFGTTFAGHVNDKWDAFISAIKQYVNGNNNVTWLSIPDDICSIKEQVHGKYVNVDSVCRPVPEKILGPYDHICTVEHIWADGDAAYTNRDGIFAILDAEGRLLTDIEAFYTEFLQDKFETHKECVYGRELLSEIAKNFEWKG